MSSPNFLQFDLASFRKAVANNNKESIEKHLSHMKNLSEAELNQALFICIENFRIDEQTDQCLFLLLRSKANPNCEINGQTPLIAACKIAQITLVKNLIENGARPDLCNSEGKHPLEFIIESRKENYDVAEYLIGSMGSVNVEIGKESALAVTVEKEFLRIFKMLVEKGAALMLSNEQSILHVIIKRKFKDSNKKKKFLKELSNRWQLSQVKDKSGKLPLDYQTDQDIRTYYQQLFKPKIKNVPDKDHHNKIKEKEVASPHQLSKQKQAKKKIKEEEQQIVQEQEGVEEEENQEEGFASQINEENKEKILEVGEEEEEERKNQEEKEKNKKNSSKTVSNTLLSTKKINKPIIKSNDKPIINLDRPSLTDKDRGKKVLADKKKKQPQLNQKKNKSFTNLTKKVEIEEQKKQEEPKKKTSSRRSSQREQESKKLVRKESEVKLQKGDIKAEEETLKIQEVIIMNEQPEEIAEQKQKSLSRQEEKQIQQLVSNMVDAVSDIFIKLEQRFPVDYEYSGESEEDSANQSSAQLEQQLTEEIIEKLLTQEKQYQKSQPCIHAIITYLQNKMKLCLQSHWQKPFTLQIAVYGSQATALCIGQSDIDLLVITSQNPNQLIKMFEFYKIFDEEQIDQVKFIKGASMPVIKLIMNQAYEKYKVDITFQLREHTGLRCAELIEEFKAAEPLLKPLVVILKQIIYAYNLSDPYTGGLGSYSLTLMVIALLQFTEISKTKQNLGRLFLQFLWFYGFKMDYVCQAIIIHPPIIGFDYKPFYSIYQLPNTMDLTPKLVIYDPINPVNNVGRTTYRISSIKNLFKVIYLRLKYQNMRVEQLLQQKFMELIQETY